MQPAKPRSSAKSYTLGEEIANSVTHGIGIALAVAALSILVTFAGLFGDAWRVVSFSVYGTTLILLYLFSTLYHAVTAPRAKAFLRILDHSAIFLLIAGTYTPYMLVTLNGAFGWTIFGLVWFLAILGITLNAFFMDRHKWLMIGLYVGMGWLVVVALEPLADKLSLAGLIWLALGGLCYSLGVVFYVWHRLPYNHAIWHLMVLAGSVCHFFGILFYVA